ncbi:MAG: glycosyltransferase [Myxococcota bacterium]|nr:glycosyltransferase [Myxococcales bacterium]
MRIGYVLKRYPRHSETFVVNEILAHERAGEQLEIFALRAPNDAHFQDLIASVRAPVRYLHFDGIKATTLWEGVEAAAARIPDVFGRLDAALGLDAREVAQAVHLAAHVRAAGIEHLHAHFATAAARVGALAAHLAAVPFTLTAHAKDIFHEEVTTEGLARIARHAACVVTVSDFNVEYLERECRLPARRLVRIYNGLPLDAYRFVDAPRERSILAVGRLVEKKGFEDLVEACAILAESGYPVPCTIIGAGPLEDELRARVRSAGLAEHVRLCGALPRSEVARQMARAGVFVAPCVVGRDGNRDGLPTVLLEAMALGTPCIATDVTGIPEVLRDGETGLVVKPHDPASIAQAIDRVLADGATATRLARAARERIERDFDLIANAGALRAEFRRARVD